jgi:hypothetical protein
MRLSHTGGGSRRSPRLLGFATALVVAVLALGLPVLASAPPAVAAGCVTCDDGDGGGGGGGGGGGTQTRALLWTRLGGLGPLFWIPYQIDCVNDGGSYIEYGTTIFWWGGLIGWFDCWKLT